MANGRAGERANVSKGDRCTPNVATVIFFSFFLLVTHLEFFIYQMRIVRVTFPLDYAMHFRSNDTVLVTPAWLDGMSHGNWIRIRFSSNCKWFVHFGHQTYLGQMSRKAENLRKLRLYFETFFFLFSLRLLIAHRPSRMRRHKNCGPFSWLIPEKYLAKFRPSLARPKTMNIIRAIKVPRMKCDNNKSVSISNWTGCREPHKQTIKFSDVIGRV